MELVGCGRILHSINEAVLPKEILEADPECRDSETKSVEGVDEQDSVWSSKHPPASSSKRSNGIRLCNIIFFVTSKIARLNEQSPNRIRCS